MLLNTGRHAEDISLLRRSRVWQLAYPFVTQLSSMLRWRHRWLRDATAVLRVCRLVVVWVAITAVMMRYGSSIVVLLHLLLLILQLLLHMLLLVLQLLLHLILPLLQIVFGILSGRLCSSPEKTEGEHADESQTSYYREDGNACYCARAHTARSRRACSRRDCLRFRRGSRVRRSTAGALYAGHDTPLAGRNGLERLARRCTSASVTTAAVPQTLGVVVLNPGLRIAGAGLSAHWILVRAISAAADVVAGAASTGGLMAYA